MQEIVRDIEGVEALVAQVNSLQHKLGGNDDSKEFISFIVDSMRGKKVQVPNGSRGNIGWRITAMFRDAQKVRRCLSTACRNGKNNFIVCELGSSNDNKRYHGIQYKNVLERENIP